jgi:hypothetical protein
MIRLQPSRTFFLACAVGSLAMPCAPLAQTHGQADTVSGPTLSVAVSSPDYDPAKLKADEGHLQNGHSLSWASGSQLFDLGKKADGMQGSGVATCTDAAYAADKGRAVIFHLVHWNVPATLNAVPQLQSSVWYVYRRPRFGKANVLVPASTTGTDDPLIYGAKHLLIINVDIPSAAVIPTTLQSTITAPVTQGTPDIATDISALFSALTGISGGATAMAAETVNPVLSVFVAVTCEDGNAKLPFSVQIADAAAQPSPTPAGGGGGGAAAAMAATTPAGRTGKTGKESDSTSNGTTSTTASGSVSCTGTGNTLPCTMGRTFTSKEHAYVDVSAGIAVPGVRDTSFTFSSSNASSGVSSSVTRHTDAYALIDVFPLGALLPKESPVPHINFGVPVTSQSLHRPYVGLGENLTGWTHLQKTLSLPIAINIFGGIAFMKTEQLRGAPTTQAAFNSDLSWHWVHKCMVGIEVPISSVTSKFSKSSSASGSKSN